MKKLLSCLLLMVMVLPLLASCALATQAAPQKVIFWYSNKGEEALVFEEAIKKYNESQSKYVVEGLSVPDQQKVKVAMSSNESPDVIKGSNQDVASYASEEALENLDAFVTRDGYDLSIYSDAAIAANRVDGSLYALPGSGYSIQMFYNKDILAEIGYSEPPSTMEEMYEMAVKATVLDADGNIERLGYPLFPLASARQELIYGFGGRWWSEDGTTLTPDNPGIIESLNMNVAYRKQYGIEKVQAFITTANTNRYTEQDMFFAGKQLFRLDGPWLPTMMQGFNSTVNYGIALVPGTAAHPENQGVSRFETNSLMIPSMAANKDGAWDFIKWMSEPEGNKIILMGTGNLPAVKSLYEDADILAKPGFAEFIEALKAEKGIQYPKASSFAEYVTLINTHLDTVYDGSKTPEEAMQELKAATEAL